MKKVLVMATFPLILISIVITWRAVPHTGNLPKEVLVCSPAIQCKYFNRNDFIVSIQKAKEFRFSSNRIIGGIVTHHLLASEMMASFFKMLADREPEVVIIIGPNHKRIGESKIHTGKWDWETPFGLLEADKNITDSLVKELGADQDINLLQEEHSISALVPYVKYYSKNAKIIPVLLHGNLSSHDAEKLTDTLLENVKGKNYIIVGSIDFSHYLPPEKADKMDEITIKAVKNADYEAISRMGNDNLDTPPTLITLLKMMKKEKAAGPEVLEHSNSTRITGTYSSSTTSYFTMIFQK